MTEPVHIIGGGLAGSEAAWQLAVRDIPVILHEMRPAITTPAHKTGDCAELVCSNSFRSDDGETNAIGLLHDEMRRAGSLILAAADAHRVPAGGALAVDRDSFAQEVSAKLRAHPRINFVREEIESLDRTSGWKSVIIASGPLTSTALAESIGRLTGEENLHFFDALAPIVAVESVDMSKAWMQSRYDKGDVSDYINCPLDKGQYDVFVTALLEAEKVEFRAWEKETPYFEGCLPIEIMAARGHETLRFGPMKPVGLTNPRAKEKPHAVVQLRRDNAQGTLWNMVGFQTKMTYRAQERVFRLISGLENAVFARLGGIHRNTFINSPRLLDPELRLKALPSLRFAGQLMGVEGYVESAAMGLLAGLFAAREVLDLPLSSSPPHTSALGALLGHVTGQAEAETFQPMNVNFGLFPTLDEKIKGARPRKLAMTSRAKRDFGLWLSQNAPVFTEKKIF